MEPVAAAPSAGQPVRLAECALCFDPLPSARLCVLRGTSGRRVCRHFLHLECMRHDATYVRRHGGRDLRCPLCNAPYEAVAELPAGDVPALFRALAAGSAPDGGRRGSGGVCGGVCGSALAAQDAKDLLQAMLWLDSDAVEDLVDRQWSEAVGHGDVQDASELQRLVRMAGSCAGRMVDAKPPLLVDDPAGWFDFWAAEALVLTRDSLVRALIKTFGTGEAEREELRAAVAAVWGLFCGEADFIGRNAFVEDDGMADALLAALASCSGSPGGVAVAAPATPPAGFWACERCTLHNAATEVVCAACEAPAPCRRASFAGAAADEDGRGSMPAPLRPPAGRPAARDRGGPPSCRLCGTGMEADRVAATPRVPATFASGGSEARCSWCRRRPPTGAAVWSCGCGAYLCVRCATISATSADTPSWMRRHSVGASPTAARRGSAVPTPGAAPPSPAPSSPAPAPPPGGLDLEASPGSERVEESTAARAAAATRAVGAAEEEDELPSHSSPRALPAGASASRRAVPTAAGAADPGPDAAAVPRQECLYCRRPGAPPGVTPVVRSSRWCQCVGGPAIAEPAEAAAAPASTEPTAEATECENCRRPRAPEGWAGVNWRRWCQCGDAAGASLRGYLRARQLLRTGTGTTSGSAGSGGGGGLSPPDVGERLDVTMAPLSAAGAEVTMTSAGMARP